MIDEPVAWLREECAELQAFLETLPEEDWARRTVFFDWSVADEVMHLHQVDNFGRIALTTPEAFPGVVVKIGREILLVDEVMTGPKTFFAKDGAIRVR